MRCYGTLRNSQALADRRCRQATGGKLQDLDLAGRKQHVAPRSHPRNLSPAFERVQRHEMDRGLRPRREIDLFAAERDARVETVDAVDR